MKTVEEIRKAGNKVRVTHYRYVNSHPRMLLPMYVIRQNNLQDLIDARGGLTTVEVVTSNGAIYNSVAECSKNDVFNTKEGVRVALERALSELRKNTFLDVSAVVNAIQSKKGQFFAVEFKKRTDGTIRRMNAKFSKKSVINMNDRLVTLWDLKKKGFRSVPLDTVIEVK